MRINEVHNHSKAAVALKSQAIATDTTTTGEIIDTKGYEAIEFIILTKAITDGDYEVKLYEGDESDMSDETELTLANEKRLGSPNFTDDTDDDAVARVGVVNKKRYVRMKVVSTNTTTGVDIISAVALLLFAAHQPTAAQNG